MALILAVDDTSFFRGVYKKVLVNAGHTVVTANDAILMM